MEAYVNSEMAYYTLHVRFFMHFEQVTDNERKKTNYYQAHEVALHRILPEKYWYQQELN